MNELYKRTLWINKNIEFLFDTEIIEYDIHAAGPSICREFKLLPESLLDEIDKMDKKSKNIKIGLIQRKDRMDLLVLVNGSLKLMKLVKMISYLSKKMHFLLQEEIAPR